MSIDFTVFNHGSIVLLSPLTLAARNWVADHLDREAMWFAGSVVIEPRYIDDILAGAERDGLAACWEEGNA